MIKPALTELIGSIIITFFGCFARLNNNDDFFTISISYFFLISGLSYAFKNISGSHFNPILSLSLIITDQISIKKGIIYFFVQILGSIIGGFCVFMVHNNDLNEEGNGEPVINADQKTMGAALEMISMYMLVYVCNSLYSDINAPKDVNGVVCGGIYLFSISAFGLITGGCVNLITVIGPSLFSGNFEDWGYYILGQGIGGISAAIIYKLFIKKGKMEDDDEEEIDTKVDKKLKVK